MESRTFSSNWEHWLPFPLSLLPLDQVQEKEQKVTNNEIRCMEH